MLLFIIIMVVVIACSGREPQQRMTEREEYEFNQEFYKHYPDL
jgi:hypothetical protein